MKNCLFLIVFLIAAQARAQRAVHFVPERVLETQDGTIGTMDVSQLANEESWKITLPTGDYVVHWRRSQIKQYDKVFVGNGWVTSQADLWEGYTMENKGRFFATTLGSKVNSIRWSESDSSFQIALKNGSRYEFSSASRDGMEAQLTCGFEGFEAPGLLTLGARTESKLCQMVEFGFVTDMATGTSFTNVQVVEAKILDWFAVVATYFYDFDVELNFRIAALIAPQEESPFPPTSDPLMTTFGNVNYGLKAWLVENGFPTSGFDVTVGITNKKYRLDPPYGGYALGDFNSVGIALMSEQTSNELNIGLMLHELGHVFGAAHDAEGGYIMSQFAAGGRWSQQAKRQISAFIQREDIAVFFQDCPRLTFTGEADDNGDVLLKWETDYEFNVGYYVLAMDNGQVLDTIYAVNSTDQEVAYEFTHVDAPAVRNIYRLYQYSVFDELLKTNNIVVDLTGQVTDDGLSVKPNPFSDRIYLENLAPGANVVILDAAGRPVFKTTAAASQLQIVTSTFKRGLYLISIDGKIFRVIKE